MRLGWVSPFSVKEVFELLSIGGAQLHDSLAFDLSGRSQTDEKALACCNCRLVDPRKETSHTGIGAV
jgi:hypothetical protein